MTKQFERGDYVTVKTFFGLGKTAMIVNRVMGEYLLCGNYLWQSHDNILKYCKLVHISKIIPQNNE